jgi:hypothetical protein
MPPVGARQLCDPAVLWAQGAPEVPLALMELVGDAGG